MPSKKKSPRYTGVLAEPMVWKLHSFWESKEELQRKNLEQYFERVKALFDHYGLDISTGADNFSLALALAKDHVPGFQVCSVPPRKRGKPEEWNMVVDSRLYADIQAGIEKGKSISQTCDHLVKAKQPYAGMKKATLEKRYRTILKKKSALPLMLHSLPYKVQKTLLEDIKKDFPSFLDQKSERLIGK